MQKKANDIIKVYNDASLTPEEWKIVGFHVQNQARHGVMRNLLAFIEGITFYYNNKYFSNIEEDN